jgi:ELWxxDGT repeat protein
MPQLVTDLIGSDDLGSLPSGFTDVGGIVFFSAESPTTGREVWKSDGTEAGTARGKDIVPGIRGCYCHYLTNVNATLYFRAVESGFELWKSDGTETGTVRVKDIRPGSDRSFPRFLTNVNGTLYFIANDGTSGYELWRSDGTEMGTVLTVDLAEGSGDSFPHQLTAVADKLFLAMTDDLHGEELWVVDLSTPSDDRNQDGAIDVRDLDAMCAALLGGTATRDDIEGFWSRQNTGPGDANFDHQFNSSDLVSVFQRGNRFETNSPASWSEGDWNCDGVFGTGDLVAAFQRGWYEAETLNAVASAIADRLPFPKRPRPSREFISTVDALFGS